MEWKPCDYGDGVGEMIFHCPVWVRPLTWFFFSPSVYYAEVGYDIFKYSEFDDNHWVVDLAEFDTCEIDGEEE